MVLQSIRERLTGVLAFVILGLLMIPFAFVGVNEYFSSGSGNQVALVNDQEITFDAFNQSFINYRRNMQQRLGAAFDPTDYDSLIARLEHLDQMIDEELLRQAAVEQEFSVDDERLVEMIREIPAFQVGGSFNRDVYQARLTAQGLSVGQFEDQMRQSVALTTLPQGISRSSFATRSEFEEFVKLSEQTRSFQVVGVPAELEAVGADFSEDEIQAWYAENAEQFQTEEQVTIEFLELDVADLATGEPPTEDELLAAYEAQQGRFITPEQRRVSHILIEAAADADEAVVEEARIEAETLAQQLAEGMDFAELAEAHSDDLGSSGIGGDLGFIEPGIMAEAFEDKVFELTLDNPVSEPVQTGFGWHLIKLTEVEPSSGMSFEEARETLLEEAREEQGEREFLDLADRMVDIVYEDPTTLEAASLDMELEIQTVGPFTRSGGLGVAANPDVVEAAFSDLVLVQGSVSDLIELEANHAVMLRVLEHDPVRVQELDEVRAQVVDALIEERATENAKTRAEELLAQLESMPAAVNGSVDEAEGVESPSESTDDQGDTHAEATAAEQAEEPAVITGALADIAQQANLTINAYDSAGRRSLEVDSALLANVFRLPRPAEGNTSYHVVEANDGYAVIGLQSVTDGVVDESAPLASRQARLMMGNVSASLESWAFVRQLREQAEVEIFEDNLGISR